MRILIFKIILYFAPTLYFFEKNKKRNEKRGSLEGVERSRGREPSFIIRYKTKLIYKCCFFVY